jgi:hypothetical protein
MTSDVAQPEPEKSARLLADAEAALLTFEKAVPSALNSLIERDCAIFRLIYTFAAIGNACRYLLAHREGVETESPNAGIRAARRLGWLSDEDAEAAIAAGQDRDVAFQMYRPGIGDQISQRLAGHAAVLRRWLEALKNANLSWVA